MSVTGITHSCVEQLPPYSPPSLVIKKGVARIANIVLNRISIGTPHV
jgi:hypothetical protein